MTREEILLQAITVPTDISEFIPRKRKEIILKNLATGGKDTILATQVSQMAPKTQEEYLLLQIPAGGTPTPTDPPNNTSGVEIQEKQIDSASRLVGLMDPLKVSYFKGHYGSVVRETNLASTWVQNLIAPYDDKCRSNVWATVSTSGTTITNLVDSGAYVVQTFPITGGLKYNITAVPSNAVSGANINYIAFSGERPCLHVGAQVYATGSISPGAPAINIPVGATHIAVRITKSSAGAEIYLSHDPYNGNYYPGQPYDLLNVSLTSAIALTINTMAISRVYKIVAGAYYNLCRPTITSNRCRVAWTNEYPAEGVPVTGFANYDTDPRTNIPLTVPDSNVNYLIVYLQYNDAPTPGQDAVQELSVTRYNWYPYLISSKRDYSYIFDVCGTQGVSQRYTFNTGCVLGDYKNKVNYVYLKDNQYYVHKEFHLLRRHPAWIRTQLLSITNNWSNARGCRIPGTHISVTIKNTTALGAHLAFYDAQQNTETIQALTLPSPMAAINVEQMYLCLVGNYLYGFGGKVSSTVNHAYTIKINLSTYEVTLGADLPKATNIATAVAYGSNILVFVPSSLYLYNIQDNTFTLLPVNVGYAASYATELEVVGNTLYMIYAAYSSAYTLIRVSLTDYTISKLSTSVSVSAYALKLLACEDWIYVLGGGGSASTSVWRFKWEGNNYIQELCPPTQYLSATSTFYYEAPYIYTLGGSNVSGYIWLYRWKLDEYTILDTPEEFPITVTIEGNQQAKLLGYTDTEVSGNTYRATANFVI